MKKVLAILLAMLMLLASTALAEDSAAVLTVDNVRLETMGQTISLQGLGASLVLENINDLPSIALLIDGNSEPLVTAVGQLTSSRFNFAIDGMGHGYTADIPAEQAAQLAQVGDAGMAVLVPTILPALDGIVLPAFAGVDIPKADMSGLLASFMTGGNTFEIPYEQVNQLLDEVLQMAKAQGSTVKDLDEAIEMLEQLRASGMGITIAGDIADDGATQTVRGDIYLVQNGTKSDEAVATLTITTSQNNFRLAVGVSESSYTMDLLTATLVSDPAAARIDFNLEVIGDTGITFTLYSEGGLQKANLYINGGSDKASLDFAYGQQNGTDVVSFGGEAGGSTISFTVNTVKGADGVRTGTVVFVADSVTFRGNLTMYTGEAIDLSGFTMPADLRPFDQLDEDGIGAAFQPVMDYIEGHATMG